MDQRIRFLEDVRLGRMSMTARCAHAQISRKTGYKWIAREAEEGRRGLADRSRAPHHCPHKITDEMATLLCEFRTGDGIYCYPLTIADLHTRYLLDCHGRYSTQTRTARPVFDLAFREYGLPRAIRIDNGPPFATTSIHGLSKLNVWWCSRSPILTQ